MSDEEVKLIRTKIRRQRTLALLCREAINLQDVREKKREKARQRRRARHTAQAPGEEPESDESDEEEDDPEIEFGGVRS